jgi:hypothetical protein
MGETRDLIGIYGAVDREAARDPEARKAVAQLLPVYEGDDEELGKVHWFDDFVAWTNERRQDGSRDAFPELKEALEGLAGEEPESKPEAKGRKPQAKRRQRQVKKPRPRMRARRLFAIALAARAFPEMRNPDSELGGLAVKALQVGGIATNDENAQRLLDVLGDPERVPRGLETSHALKQWWDELLETAENEGLIDDPKSMGPRPCTGRLVTVDLPGGARQVATLKTSFETNRLKFADAIKFLEPSTWPKCSDFWCRMDKVAELPAGEHRYNEVVSVDCGDQDTTWTLQAVLDFRYWGHDGLVAVAEYQLPGGQAQPGNVLVDEGSLVVRKLGAGAAEKLAVTTTKRVLFDRIFDGRAIALVMCALGYAEVAHDFVFHAAALTPAQRRSQGKPFPGKEPRAPAKLPVFDFATMIKALSDETAASVKACIDDYADAVQETTEKIEQGKYTPDDAVGDMAKMSTRIAREGAAAVDAGVRSTRAARRPGARRPSEH